MSKLKSIHQYNNKIATETDHISSGWDGTNGPWCMNLLTQERVHVHMHNTGYNKGGTRIDNPEEWHDPNHNTGFMLEFIY